MEGIILGVCNPLLDITANVTHEYLEKYGLKPSNATLATPELLPLYGEIEKQESLLYSAGGAGQNSIRAAQWMLQIPSATSYIGCVGNDEYGRRLREEATHDGVNVHYQVTNEHPTGSCAVLVTNKERSLVANLAAANHCSKSHFESEPIQKVVNKAKYIYATGFFITVSPETLFYLGQHACENNKFFILNISAPFVVDYFWQHFEPLLEYVDILFGNEHEFAALSAKLNFTGSFDELARNLAERSKRNTNRLRTIVITQGSANTLVYHEGQLLKFTPTLVPKEQIVDLNGAGDSFVGGFLAGLALSKPIEKCVEAAHYCAGFTITRAGITFRGFNPTFTF
eukprot:TRINITY_DN171_c1_g1_i1.p1 TRINITY_DN171_c1_g1~~TRINITY_DN171_c1_g1_i1.p1  ORF type:complete len:341 (-),score=160.59 TRINITY_DN171_c1_g1_i1:86-1108(-)